VPITAPSLTAVSGEAQTRMRRQMRRWDVARRSDRTLTDLARMFNAVCCRAGSTTTDASTSPLSAPVEAELRRERFVRGVSIEPLGFESGNNSLCSSGARQARRSESPAPAQYLRGEKGDPQCR
jgi:hypothetical protein